MILALYVAPGLGLAIEARSRPDLLDRPTVIGGLPRQRGVVREVSFPAQNRGIYPGMTLAQAHQLCPDALFLLPDVARDEGIWQDLCAVLGRFTPVVEPVALGEVLCDLTGLDRHWGDERGAARAIVAAVREHFGFTPWVGVAAGRLTAQLAARRAGTPGIVVVERGYERDFLADLPLTLLPGVDARLALTFQVLGLRTMGQLAALPAAAVRRRFGAHGERLHALAGGVDPRPVVTPPERPAVTVRRECEEGSWEDALAVLHRLTEECAAELQQRNLAGTLVTLTLEWPAGEERAQPMRDALPAPALPEPASPGASTGLPVPYRIHSMLPQPVTEGSRPAPTRPLSRDETDVSLTRADGTSPMGTDGIHNSHPITPFTGSISTVARTPVASPDALWERAQPLLVRGWPGEEALALRAIMLRVSEFEAPHQLRLGLGGLDGLDPGRLTALRRQEEVLSARYGDTSFRRLVHLDPAGVLAERRFRWGAGLPWERRRR